MSSENLTAPIIQIVGQEPFSIGTNDWNEVVEYFYKTRPLTCTSTQPPVNFRHPWHTQLEWNFDRGEWTADVNPGFIRGHGVVAKNVPETLVSPRTFQRLGLGRDHTAREDRLTTARLSESPKIPIPKNLYKEASGPNTLAVERDGEAVESKSIPEIFYKLFNVKVDRVIEVNTVSPGITIDTSDADDQDPQVARQLHYFEIVLVQPRPVVEPVITDDPSLGNDVLNIQVRYADPDEEPPFIRFYSTLPQELLGGFGGQLSALDAVAAAVSGEDLKHVATVWMLGPPGDMESKYPDSTWTPIVQHHLHWNLDYTVNAQIENLPPLRFMNPAAALIGGDAAQPLVDALNQEQSQIEQLMATVKIEGDFWSI